MSRRVACRLGPVLTFRPSETVTSTPSPILNIDGAGVGAGVGGGVGIGVGDGVGAGVGVDIGVGIGVGLGVGAGVGVAASVGGGVCVLAGSSFSDLQPPVSKPSEPTKTNKKTAEAAVKDLTLNIFLSSLRPSSQLNYSAGKERVLSIQLYIC